MTGRIVTIGRTRYELVSEGCDWERCEHERPAQAYQLDSRGKRRYSLTHCINLRDAE